MSDQAEKLRQMIEKSKKDRKKPVAESDKTPSLTAKTAEIIAVSSGKGGVGKSNISLNLAIALSKMDRKVVIIDADLGLANIDVILGLIPKYNLMHLIEGKRSIDEVILEGPAGINIISGGSGIKELANLSGEKLDKLIASLESLYTTHDYMIIDTGAGISDVVLSFIRAASRLFLVLTPDPASITDAYSMLKNIKDDQDNIACIINRVESKNEAIAVFEKLSRASQKFLDLKLSLLGHVLEDSNVIRAVRNQQAFFLDYPNTAASKCISFLANSLEGETDDTKNKLSFGGFIKKLFRN